MYPFKVGDYVGHKLKDFMQHEIGYSLKMLVCAVRNEDDLPMGQVVMRKEAREFPIGCRYMNRWNREVKYQLEWFAVEELELWPDK